MWRLAVIRANALLDSCENTDRVRRYRQSTETKCVTLARAIAVEASRRGDALLLAPFRIPIARSISTRFSSYSELPRTLLTSSQERNGFGEAPAEGPFLLIYVASLRYGCEVNGIPSGKLAQQFEQDVGGKRRFDRRGIRIKRAWSIGEEEGG